MDALDSALAEVRTAAYDVPNLIGGDEVRTDRWMPVVTPHAHAVALGQVHRAGPAETTVAIEARAGRLRVVGATDARGADRAVPAGG